MFDTARRAGMDGDVLRRTGEEVQSLRLFANCRLPTAHGELPTENRQLPLF